MLFNKKILSTFFASTMLFSCTISKPNPAKISYDDYKGYYKVGDPYEIDGKWYYPKEQPDYDEVGISSWYGDDFHGKETANGDTFDKRSLTAAHNTLPLPSMVRVTNLENNKTIILMINDRGPFAKGRVIDVSERAADILGFKEKGVAKVRVQFLKGQTNRLLAGIKNAPSSVSPVDKESGFSLFKSAETKSPYAMDDGDFEQADDNKPLGLALDKNKILDPVKKLSNLLSKKEDVPITPAPKPEIIIHRSAGSQMPSTEELPDKIIVKNTNVVEKSLDSIDVAEKDAVVKTVGDWQGDIEMSEIEKSMISTSDKAENKHEVADEQRTFVVKENIKILPEKNQHFVQAGTYSNVSNAYRIEKKLKPLGDVVVVPVTIGERKLYRVRLGPIPNEKVAKLALQKVVNLGHPDAMIVKELPSVQ